MQAKAFLADCDNCPLKMRPHCPSYVPEDAVLTVIGEAPGINEVIEQIPFIGVSGQILDHALEYAGVDPNKVARTNAVLCRPYGTEDPPEAAIIACSKRLDYDIRRARAKQIVAAGNVAARALDRLSNRDVPGGILARAGQTYDYHRTVIAGDDRVIDLRNHVFKYTATVNPAFLIHSDAYAPHFVRHIQYAANPYDRIFPMDRVRYAIMTPDNAERIITYINSFADNAPMAFDVEGDHLQWFSTPELAAAELLCLVITLEDWRSVIVPINLYELTNVRECIENALKRYNVIAHNGKFDQNFMAARVATYFDIHDDTMLMHYALYELGKHGLKDLATEYLGAPDYEGELITSWFKEQGIKDADRRYSLIPKDRLYKYAAIDGMVTLQLWRLFDAELRAKGLYDWPYRNVLIEVANALPIVEQTGIGVDRAQLTSNRLDFESELHTILAQMNDTVIPLIEALPDRSVGELKRLMTTRIKIADGAINPKTGKRGRATYTTALQYNPKSPQQTHHILYNILNLKLQKRLIKPTTTSTGKEALEALPDHPFIQLLRHHRRIAKMTDTYIGSIERRATIDDLIHVDFRITGTEIGRLSATGGDHGIPRPDDYYGAAIRSMFVTLDENEVFIIADYTQAELRALAHLANVKFLKDKYNAGEDVHTETALMLERFGATIFAGFEAALHASEHAKDVDERKRAKLIVKRLRVLAKNINFGNVYQGGPTGISGMIGGAIPASVVKSVLAVYHQIMPEAREYAISQMAYLRQHGYVKTIFNRHRRFYVLSEANEDEAKKAVVHMVVASAAADLTNLSTARLVKQGVRVCHTIHDSLIARARIDEAPQVARAMVDTMQRTGSEFMSSIPWIADIETLEDGSYPRRWCARPDRSAFDEWGKLRAA